MANPNDPQTEIDAAYAEDEHEGRAPGSFGEPDERASRDGGIDGGTDDPATLTPEQQMEYARRRAAAAGVDDNAASHQGGMGAQSGQADYGSAGNLAGGIAQRDR